MPDQKPTTGLGDPRRTNRIAEESRLPHRSPDAPAINPFVSPSQPTSNEPRVPVDRADGSML
ncbi:hypothetical protein IP84_00740 [beta proteobacterium AAP99]|nr:hypothetical protein IP84_00740 [beta proteobacterium AAP99]